MKQPTWQVFGILGSLVVFCLVSLVIMSCSEQQRSPVEPSLSQDIKHLSAAISDADVECVVEKPLWAGAAHNDTTTGVQVGTVTVRNDFATLEVVYNLEGGYTLNEARVYVGTSRPPKVAPGQFPYIYTSEPLSVPLSTFDTASEHTIYIAAYAEVCSTTCEGAWAGGDTDDDHEFIEEGISKKWGWYFSYIMSCDDRRRLATTMADMRHIGSALGDFWVDNNGRYPTPDEWDTFVVDYQVYGPDGWGGSFQYTHRDFDPMPDPTLEYMVESFGKDGLDGAVGPCDFDKDILFSGGEFLP